MSRVTTVNVAIPTRVYGALAERDSLTAPEFDGITWHKHGNRMLASGPHAAMVEMGNYIWELSQHVKSRMLTATEMGGYNAKKLEEIAHRFPMAVADPAAEAPARQLPAIAIACPLCDAAPGDLCATTDGKGQRTDDLHIARTRVYEMQQKAQQAPPAPEIGYDPRRGWSIDGTVYRAATDAAVALHEHPGYEGTAPLDFLLDLQVPSLNASLPNGVELCGDPATGYEFLCSLDSCSLADPHIAPVEWPTQAHAAAVKHVVSRHVQIGTAPTEPETTAPEPPAAPQAPVIGYEPWRGWIVDGTLHNDVRDAADDLLTHPAYTGDNPMDDLLTVQLPVLSDLLPDGITLHGDRASGYGWTCTMGQCDGRRTDGMDYPGGASRSAERHLDYCHEAEAEALPRYRDGSTRGLNARCRTTDRTEVTLCGVDAAAVPTADADNGANCPDCRAVLMGWELPRRGTPTASRIGAAAITPQS